MASIRKHGNKWEVQYRICGHKKPFSERFDSEEEANLRKAQVEFDAKKGRLAPPATVKSVNPLTRTELEKSRKTITLGELMERYMRDHGEKNMTPSCFANTQTRIERHIVPHIGDIPVVELTAPLLADYFSKLSEKVVSPPGQEPHQLSMSTIGKCKADIRAALNWAMSKGIIDVGFNMAAAAELPEAEENDEADADDYIAWDIDELNYALERCTDKNLRFVILMCFACTMRIGELLALDWEHVNVLYEGHRSVHIEYQLQRAKEEHLNRSPKTKAYFIFPKQKPDAESVLYLASPKKGSKRYVQYGETVAEALRQRAEQQDLEKRLMGDDYTDFGLVLAQPNGRPYEAKTFCKRLRDFCEQEGLPNICTHSLRHTSIDIKLELSGGSIRDVMADAGHRTEKMTTVQYAAMRNRRRGQTADKLDALLKAGTSKPKGQAM